MTTLQTGPLITADKEVTARLTVSQWLGVVGAIVLSAGFFYTSLNRLETSIVDAAREAKAAAADAAGAEAAAGGVASPAPASARLPQHPTKS